MGKRGKSSIVHQVKSALKEIDQIGLSKRTARINDSHGIHSIKQKDNTMSDCQNFVKWVKQQGVTKLYQLKEDHYRSYLDHLKKEKRSIGHQRNVETSLRHLQKAMNVRSSRFGREQVVWVPNKRITDWRELEPPKNRSYTVEEYKLIRENVPENSRRAVDLMRNLGLRVREACNVKKEHFEPSRNGEGWQLNIKNGKGVTKGGRFRKTPIPKHFERQLQQMLKNKGPEDRLVTVSTDTVRRAVNEACRKASISQNGRGTHGFRHAYSRERLEELFVQRGIGREGPKMIARIMYNKEQGRNAWYGINTGHDKELYGQVKNCIDQVHSEIGHGKDRWDLASIYLKD
ncbi:tyrosine-type recombinase/integrase [Pontibacillus salipaludis]|uniref:Tyr recombinase domain-containing protein n=1 Tax=Pontibacillus salipaludis TaxID=1697394 RepID=A0ABQ1QJQ6_9BACI|nr:site-specific integrase [Pontibacillus salipaludis]GGD29676.1 hypothetical protein GCM10011389_41540 [Pontibacillus salipaludis]